MLISSSLPSPLNTSRRSRLQHQPDPTERNRDPDRASTRLSKTPQQNIVSPDREIHRTRFVMPDNATSRRGQTALREYQMIQNEGGPELVNRIDVLV